MNDRSVFSRKGPLLLACNHPNSFLDAVIIGSHFQSPVHFLARGDAFKKPAAKKILSALKLIPIYRLREGRENLALNDATFDRCREVLLNNGILLIFSEGLCENNWKLRPLKKGTARIAIDAWQQENIKNQFMVVPISLNYNSFTFFGKELIINFNDLITLKELSFNESAGETITNFNYLLSQRLKNGLIESRSSSPAVQMLISNHSGKSADIINELKAKIPFTEKVMLGSKPIPPYYLSGTLILDLFLALILLIPSIIGWLLHAPVYLLMKKIIKNKTRGTVFYDSVMFGSMLIIYPLYWILLIVITYAAFGDIWVRLLILVLPLFAWMFIQWRVKCIALLNRIKAL